MSKNETLAISSRSICTMPGLFTDLELTGNPTTHSTGRISLKVNGETGYVCDDGWNTHAAEVVCSQLGLSGKGLQFFSGFFRK